VANAATRRETAEEVVVVVAEETAAVTAGRIRTTRAEEAAEDMEDTTRVE